MVNALLRMCLKRISAKSWDYCYYKSHLFDTKRLWIKKTVCARRPWLWHGPGPGWLCYSIVRGQCKTFKFWTVKWALHLPPDLCKGKQHSWVVNACLLQEAGEQNSHDVPGVFSTIQFLSLRHLLGFLFLLLFKRFQKRILCCFFLLPLSRYWLQSEISRGDFKRRPWLPSLCQFISSALHRYKAPSTVC